MQVIKAKIKYNSTIENPKYVQEDVEQKKINLIRVGYKLVNFDNFYLYFEK